jgi:hypothetical protein
LAVENAGNAGTPEEFLIEVSAALEFHGLANVGRTLNPDTNDRAN